MEISTETIDPGLAKSYLTLNTRNRPMNKKRAKAYSEAMLNGDFDGMNGDSIRFDVNGTLIDGQKRLFAIIQSDVPLTTLVIRGLPVEAFKTIDSQESRSHGQRFSVEKEKNYNALASGLSLLFRYKNLSIDGEQTGLPTFSQIQLLLERNDMRQDVNFISASKDLKKICAASVMSFCHYGFRMADEYQCLAFFEVLLGNSPALRTNPALLLRERLQDNRASKSKLPTREVVAIWIKAFNAFCMSAEIKQLRWSPGAGEKFPHISGFHPSDVL